LEEISRFILEDKRLTTAFKRLRHRIDTTIHQVVEYPSLIKARKSTRDIGRNIYINELKRKNCQDIFFANIQRVKESTRVLEEFSKLKNQKVALGFKKIRYTLYEIEKKATRKVAALCNYR
ncbi:MAG: hypothetical protein NC928_02500, partial [Candidatus Omnitrophica bacterium]|nr:hypothetical protein [Candidatus Omnitrophota bacterium]